MIRFFSKIRYKLATENKVGKYLRYAIGEILLVVIGILFALQINNWNQQRKDNASELEILNGLQNEFNSNLDAINNSVNQDRMISHGCFNIIALIRSGKMEEQSEKLDSLLQFVGSFGSFDAVTGVTDEIINSGKLHILKNDSLRIKLTQWSGRLTDSKEDLDYRFENYHHNLMPFFTQNFPLVNGDLTKEITNQLTGEILPNIKGPSPFKTNFEELNLMEFESVIWLHKHNNDYVLYTDTGLKKEIQTILELIKSDISKKKQ
ncbi:DUF6090 family protein [uncultured Draconibacterium sp.]|uniref:DUF6090 family protein n=1 Tax=uncultured Draconibacterium sp. TaxID=1573823 RepID=UPI0029C61D11|nr:DUF6090 family protein [uncultured Draconibacterium sp.]